MDLVWYRKNIRVLALFLLIYFTPVAFIVGLFQWHQWYKADHPEPGSGVDYCYLDTMVYKSDKDPLGPDQVDWVVMGHRPGTHSRCVWTPGRERSTKEDALAAARGLKCPVKSRPWFE